MDERRSQVHVTDAGAHQYRPRASTDQAIVWCDYPGCNKIVVRDGEQVPGTELRLREQLRAQAKRDRRKR